MARLFISTDLDGTLLDHDTYSFAAAEPMLGRLRDAGVPVILNTSKTYAELLELRQALGHEDPFIVENGAAAYIPAGLELPESSALPMQNNLRCKAFGPARKRLLEVLDELRENYRFTGFHEMTVTDVVAHTGLSETSATLAQQREFTEPLVWNDSIAALKAFSEELNQVDMQTQKGGRFVHVMGLSDKAKAMRWLADQYAAMHSEPITLVALGDGQNDVGMLKAADIPVVIRSPVHAPPEIPGRNDAILSKDYGPVGWAASLENILAQYGL